MRERPLLDQTDALDSLDVVLGTAVEDGELWGVDLDEAVVHALGIERCHSVLDGADGG